MKSKPLLHVDELSPEINKYIGRRIGMMRTKLNYSHAYVGNKIGRSGELVRQIENAKTAPSPGTLAAIAAVLMVDISYFFEGLNFRKESESCGKQLKIIKDYILSIDDVNITISTDAMLVLKKRTNNPNSESDG